MFKKITKSVNELSLNLVFNPALITLRKTLGFAALIAIPALSFAGNADDMLANTGVTAEVEGTFGPGSTVAVIIYFVEFLAGLSTYIATKKFWALAGTPIVIIVTGAIFKLIQANGG